MERTKMPENTTQRVIRVIAENQRIPVETIQPESTFQELKIDSLDDLDIISALEEEFNIDIPDDAGKEFTSIRQAIDGVEMLLEKKQAASSGPA